MLKVFGGPGTKTKVNTLKIKGQPSRNLRITVQAIMIISIIFWGLCLITINYKLVKVALCDK